MACEVRDARAGIGIPHHVYDARPLTRGVRRIEQHLGAGQVVARQIRLRPHAVQQMADHQRAALCGGLWLRLGESAGAASIAASVPNDRSMRRRAGAAGDIVLGEAGRMVGGRWTRGGRRTAGRAYRPFVTLG